MKRVRGEVEVQTKGRRDIERARDELGRFISTGQKGSSSGGGGWGLLELGAGFAAVHTSILAINSSLQGVNRAIGSLLSAGNAVQRSNLTWSALLGNIEDTYQRVGDIERFASKAPFELRDIDAAAISMQSLGRYSEQALTAAGDAAAIFGRNIKDATQALLGASRGELEMLESFGVAKFELAAKMGKDVKDVGMQTRDDLNALWEAAISVMEEKYGGAMDRLVATNEGKLSMIADSVFRAEKKMSEGGLTEGVGRGLDLVIDRLEQMHQSGIFEDIGKALGATLEIALDKASGLLQVASFAFAGKEGTAALESATSLAERIQGERGLTPPARSMGGKMKAAIFFGKQPPNIHPELKAATRQAALILLGGGTEEEAAAVIEGAALFLALSDESPGAGALKRIAKPGRGRSLSAVVPRPELDGLEREMAKLRTADMERDDPTRGLLPNLPKILEEEWAPRIIITHQMMLDSLAKQVSDGTLTMGEAFAQLSLTAGVAYQGIARGGATAMQGLTLFVRDSLLYQGKAHLNLRNVARAAALGMASGMIEAQSDVWRNLGEGYLKQAAAFAILGDFSGAARLGAIGGGLLALAGASAGIAGALDAKAQERLSGTGSLGAAPTFSDTSIGGSGASGGSSPGARLVSAGAAPQTVNNIVNVTYQGPVVYSEGGMRYWFRSEIIPLLQEAYANGWVTP